MTDRPREQLLKDSLRAIEVNPPIDEIPSLDEIREDVTIMKHGKAADVSNISVELLKAKCEGMTRWLHVVLAAICHSGTISLNWKGAVKCWEECPVNTGVRQGYVLPPSLVNIHMNKS